jgi:crossover junction endodeoxyribonuclease RusA
MSNDKVAATFHPTNPIGRRWVIPVEVPWASEVVSMNARSHWTNTHRQIQALRARGAYVARGANPPMPHFDKATVCVYLRFPDRRRRDIQNYHKTLKALIDGFVDAGLLPDDDSTHLYGFDVRTWAKGVDPEIDYVMIVREAARPTLSLVFVFEGFMT